MGLNQTDLNAIYDSLKQMCSNISLDDIPLFKNGNILLPRYKKGHKIHIKKKNRGKFTASAKRAGQSVQEHARSVLNNPNATPLQKKRANFARNAAKWKHQDGGTLFSKWQKYRQPVLHKLNPNKYPLIGGGQGGGGGASTTFQNIPKEEWKTVTDTLYIPIQQTFNEAFADARKNNLSQFTFNGKLYTTEMGNNPNNVIEGERRTQNIGVLPIEHKKKIRISKNE